MASIASLNKDKLDALREEFCTLLLETGREGMEDMIAYLESTDFFTAPASTSKHGALYGGLIMHSLEVYRLLENFSKPIKDVKQDTLIICGLLHDVCKANMYTVKTRNVKNEQGRWEEVESFAIDDQFPFGHGEKSVFLISRHIKLTDEEALAIRWHMGGYDDAARSYVGGITQANAFEKAPLCVALHLADMYAAHFRI